MKSILFYSPDLNLCASLLMFFNEKYLVTTTTDFTTFEGILASTSFDLLVIDSEPTDSLVELCNKLQQSNLHAPIILTYVFTIKFSDKEALLKNTTDAIFYKPIDLFEVSQKIDRLMLQHAE